jgi:small subunit ribosomal protein S9
MVKKEQKSVATVGKRKDAVARATVTAGRGRITVNSVPLDLWSSEFLRMRVKEPVLIAGDLAKNIDIAVSVRGGGTTGQTESVRMAVARGIVDFARNEDLRQKFIQYDRNLLVFDPRRNEPHHAGGASKRGSRRHKQRSKR